MRPPRATPRPSDHPGAGPGDAAVREPGDAHASGPGGAVIRGPGGAVIPGPRGAVIPGPRGAALPGPAARRAPVSAADRVAAAQELAGIRDLIDELDRRIVDLLNERAALGRAAGRAKALAGRRAVRDPEREREVLLRIAMANNGPLGQADLLSIYRRIVAVTRGLEARDRTHDGRSGDG